MSSTVRKEYHHGRTPAAWAGTSVSMVGFIIATIAFFLPGGINWVVLYVGLAIAVGGAIVGGVMKKMGLGQD